MEDPGVSLEERRRYSNGRLDDLSAALNAAPEIAPLTETCVYATGSYARGEATQQSDIDLFFVDATEHPRNLVKLPLLAAAIRVATQLGFPPFSNDGEFLQVLSLRQMLELLGGREDDHANYFTARMLMLLESKPVVGRETYKKALSAIVGSYYRDYPGHEEQFRPIFLINDIVRYWKTLCLNYEHRRNEPASHADKSKHSVKNFKLKFSRLMSCFGTIVSVCADPTNATQEKLCEIAAMPPIQRFLDATASFTDIAETRRQVLEEYEWFLSETADSERLAKLFETQSLKEEHFRRADNFGHLVYEVLAHVAEKSGYSRYLII